MLGPVSWQPPTVNPPPGYPPTGYPPPGFPPPGYPPTGFYGPPPGPAPGLLYAGFGRRLGGYLIDGLIQTVPIGILIFALFWNSIDAYARRSISVGPGLAPRSLFDILPLGAVVGFVAATAILYGLYFGVLVSVWGHTVGQAAVGTRVVRRENPQQNLPLGRAMLRSIVWWGLPALEFIPFAGGFAGLAALLAFLWVAWDPEKQGLHDKLGNAVVVRPMPGLLMGPPPGIYAAG